MPEMAGSATVKADFAIKTRVSFATMRHAETSYTYAIMFKNAALVGELAVSVDHNVAALGLSRLQVAF